SLVIGGALIIGHPSQYGFPPAASSAARLTATLSSRTLYSFWLSGRTPSHAASPAAVVVASVTSLPSNTFAADSLTSGVGWTWPRTTRTPVASLPPRARRKAPDAWTSGHSLVSLCFTS